MVLTCYIRKNKQSTLGITGRTVIVNGLLGFCSLVNERLSDVVTCDRVNALTRFRSAT